MHRISWLAEQLFTSQEECLLLGVSQIFSKSSLHLEYKHMQVVVLHMQLALHDFANAWHHCQPPDK
jgi:hypothetical protein